MRTFASARVSLSDVPAIAGVALAYVIFAELGFSLAFQTRQVTAVWPPTGIAVACLLLFGYRVWPGILLGAFASNALAHEPAATAAAIAVGNTLGPLLGVYALLRFVGFDNGLERLRDVFGLVFLGAALAMCVTATNGVFNLALAGIVPWHEYGSVWVVWWAGDAMGVLLVAPLILTWATPSATPNRGRGRTWEYALLIVSVALVTWLSFTGVGLRPYPIYPFMIWSALRFRQRETSTTIALISAIAVWGTAHGTGPFGAGPLDARLTLLMAFMAALAITGFVLGSVRAEWRVAEASLEAALGKSTRVAQTLQSAFLPKQLPRRDDLRLDALYLTAGREALIGGDWYDAFELADGRIVISIGDVTGHGLDAAVTAGRIRQGIVATAFDTVDPSAILRKVNRMLQYQDDTVATALVAVVDRELANLQYASAGHPPPIVAGPTIPVQSLPYGGLPLGIAGPNDFQTRSVRLERDAVVLFYTDGLTEFNREIESAERILRDAVTVLVGDTATASPAQAIQHAVMGSERPTDDTALLVLQLSPIVVADALAGASELRQTWNFHSSDVYSAHAARHTLMSFLRHFAAPDADLFRTELILGEILSNTVEHAPGPVTVEIDWRSTNPIVTILDAGPGLSVVAPKLPADKLTENGRGLFLIATLAADVHVESSPGSGTTMRVTLPVSRER